MYKWGNPEGRQSAVPPFNQGWDMLKRHLALGSGLVLMAVIVAACGSAAPATAAPPAASATPDACAPENIRTAAGAVNQFMRQFDDESQLASYVPQHQLAGHIAALQSVRRAAQDQTVPICLQRLKQLQVTHMNTVISTLMTFLGGGDQQAVAAGVRLAQRQHDAYLIELAGALGITAVVVTRVPSATAAPGTPGTPSTVSPSQQATIVSATATVSSGVVAFNAGTAPVNLRAEPSQSGQILATLAVGGSATALGVTSDGAWIQVVLPGQPGVTAWVLAADVQLTNANP